VTGDLEDLAFGVVLGFSLVVPPGPMNAWIAAASVRSFRAGCVTGLGAMSADALLGAVVYLLARTVDLSAAVRFVYLVGAGVMAYLGARLVRPSTASLGDVPVDRRYLRALGVGLSNPFQVVWWLTAGVAFAYLGGIVLLLGLFGAIGVWIVAFPSAVHAGARRDARIAEGIRLASAGILIAFAVYFVVLFVVA
jgi:threonine/homoserine/homoserine lactone efflux protein